MKNLKYMLVLLGALLQATVLYGQGTYKVTGKILSSLNKPVEGAVVTVDQMVNVTTEADGTFAVEVKNPETAVSVPQKVKLRNPVPHPLQYAGQP